MGLRAAVILVFAMMAGAAATGGLFGVALFSAAVGTGLLVFRSHIRAILRLRASANAIRGGDYSVSSASDARGAIGEFARTFDSMRIDQGQAVMALSEVSDDRAASQARYQILYENTQDVIFSMRPNLQISDANPAAARLLGIRRQELKGRNFFDLVSTGGQRSLAPVLLMRVLAEFTEKKGSMIRRLTFLRDDGKETREYDVRLEFLNSPGADEIIARATPVRKDVLLAGLVSESLSFRMHGDLMLVDTLAQRLARNLPRYCTDEESFSISLGLREIIINAIEHGNLAITSEEKSAAMAADTYMTLLQERARDPRFKDRMVTISYLLDAKQVVYTITDEGDGFDHASIAQNAMPDAHRAHGRGILITQTCFDSVVYNEKGNSVELKKSFA